VQAGWALLQRQDGGCRCATGTGFFYNGPLLGSQLARHDASSRRDRFHALRDLARAAGSNLDLIVSEAHPALLDVRSFLYLSAEGWTVSPEYTHIWDTQMLDQTFAQMNREKRREIRRAGENHTIEKEAVEHEAISRFIALHACTMKKFGWSASASWETMLRARLDWMAQRDGCALYTARAATGEVVATLLALMSREDDTVYFWKMGNAPQAKDSGVNPALYWNAANAVAREGFRFVNLGGSHQAELSRFKDFLGAEPTLHFRLIRRREGWPLRAWDCRQRARVFARRFLAAHPAIERARRRLRAK
jgi:hypothetical protein